MSGGVYLYIAEFLPFHMCVPSSGGIQLHAFIQDLGTYNDTMTDWCSYVAI